MTEPFQLVSPEAPKIDPFRRIPIDPLCGLPRVLAHYPHGYPRPEFDGKRVGSLRVRFTVMGQLYEEVVTSEDLDREPARDEEGLRELIAKNIEDWFSVIVMPRDLVLVLS